MMRELLLFTSALLASTPGCAERFDEPQLLGGVVVQPEILNRGMQLFRRDCAGCHGDDGKGQAAKNPAERGPRDLTLGFYKFTSVPDNRLPTDDDLMRTIREGLDGTQMVARPELNSADLHALVQYVKTLSTRWSNEFTGTPIVPEPDPWGVGRRQEAIARGFAVYHGLAQCWTCHPSYVPLDRLQELASATLPAGADSIDKAIQFRGDITRSRVVETAYGDVLPPDFLDDRVRAAKGPEGLYRAIAVGLGGTPMPTWKDQLSSEDLWATVYYVRELTRLRGSPAARAMAASPLMTVGDTASLSAGAQPANEAANPALAPKIPKVDDPAAESRPTPKTSGAGWPDPRPISGVTGVRKDAAQPHESKGL